MLFFKSPIFAIVILINMLLSTAAFAMVVEKKLADDALEARAKALFHEVRCVVCEGQALDDSSADLAQDMRHLIRERIRTGASDDEIKQFLVSRYGQAILMKPPVNQQTALLWFMPFALLAVGFVALMRQKSMPPVQKQRVNGLTAGKKARKHIARKKK